MRLSAAVAHLTAVLLIVDPEAKLLSLHDTESNFQPFETENEGGGMSALIKRKLGHRD